MEGNRITALVISQQSLLRQGIEHALAATTDVKIIGAADVDNNVLSDIDTIPPDVALIDVDGFSDYGNLVFRFDDKVRISHLSVQRGCYSILLPIKTGQELREL